jgi:hypothetical protein
MVNAAVRPQDESPTVSGSSLHPVNPSASRRAARIAATWHWAVAATAAPGAVAGEVADPAGGGVLGRVGGKVLGGAIGAGAGWLADEGVGLLYRHLGPTARRPSSRRGVNTPQIVMLSSPRTCRTRSSTQ